MPRRLSARYTTNQSLPDCKSRWNHNGGHEWFQVSRVHDKQHWSSVKCRKAAAWRTCNKFKRVWKSQMNRSIKIREFWTAVECVLLYGLETSTLTKGLGKTTGWMLHTYAKSSSEHSLVRSHLWQRSIWKSS